MSKIIQNFKNISYGPAPEDSTDVMSWINSLNNPNHLYINGSWTKSKASKKIQVININFITSEITCTTWVIQS